VIALDHRESRGFPDDVEFHAVDLTSKRVRDLLKRTGIAGVVHLGVLHNPRAQHDRHEAWNMLSLRRLFDCVEQFEIPKLVLLSSANVYGPRPDNAQLLSEEAPLLAAGRFSEIRDLVELDLAAQGFFWRNPQTETVILRPSHILGTVRNAPSNYLRLKRVPTLLGFDPMMQVVHQDDLVTAIDLALAPGIRGMFNLAGPQPVSLSQALSVLGRQAVPLPHSLARAALERLFRWRVTSFPAAELDFIRYVCMVDDSRARHTLGYAPAHDLRATLSAVDDERWLD
jgi:UDP-glucose 4-epimerase